MKLKRLNFFLPVLLMMIIGFGWTKAEAYQDVKVENQQLKEDYDHDGIYKIFLVKGVGYSPMPIGDFMGYGDGWSALCYYSGPYPLNYPNQRFNSQSPDSAYQCYGNGTNNLQDFNAVDRDFNLLKAMKANTIRAWGNVTPQLLQKANQYGLKVIAGYWIDHNLDFTFPDSPNQSGSGQARRQALINDFVNYVNTYKNDPAILMWGLSNENNIAFCNTCIFGAACDRAIQANGYYRLMNDMALAAKTAEGNSFHPTTIVLAGAGNVISELTSYANVLTAIDIIGINAYQGKNFDLYRENPPGSGHWERYANLFEEFQKNLPTKGVLITEFGVDAWNTNGHDADPQNGLEDQASQASWETSAWDDLVNHSVIYGGSANGGVVFNYSDDWNQYVQRPADAGPCTWVSSDWTPSVRTQDHGFTDPAIFGAGVMPDNRQNPEWWGIVSVQKNPTGGIDIVQPRQTYYALQQKFGLNLVQDVIWQNVIGATATGNTLQKTAAVGWGNAGAVSTKVIVFGNGFVEFTVNETKTYRMAGLSNGDSNQNYTDIDYAIYPAANGYLYVYEQGVYKGQFGTYSVGDILRVSVENGVVKYRKNGGLLYTSTLKPVYPLLIDTALYSTGATIAKAVISGNLAENVGWQNVIGATANINVLQKTATTGWGNSGAVSTKTIASGNGFIEFSANETNTYRMAGLSNGDSNQNYTDIDFAFYMAVNGSLYIYEQGVYKGSFGTYTVGDRMRIGVEGGVVKYRKNGALLYTSTLKPNYPLLIDTSLYTTGATVAQAVMSTP